MNLVWAQGFRSVSLPLIEARQTGRPSGSSSQIFSFGVLIKHGCESPNLEMLMGKTAVNGWVIFHCHVTWMFVYRRVCCLVLYILIDICVQNMCQVSTSDIWEKTLSNPNATLLGYPFWETSIYIYILWFIVIHCDLCRNFWCVCIYIYTIYIYIYPYVPTFERQLPHSGCRQIALWIGSIDGFWQRKCSNSGRRCGEAGWNTWAMIC